MSEPTPESKLDALPARILEAIDRAAEARRQKARMLAELARAVAPRKKGGR